MPWITTHSGWSTSEAKQITPANGYWLDDATCEAYDELLDRLEAEERYDKLSKAYAGLPTEAVQAPNYNRLVLDLMTEGVPVQLAMSAAREAYEATSEGWDVAGNPCPSPRFDHHD